MFDRKYFRGWLRTVVMQVGCVALVCLVSSAARAQAGWEGETGIFVTPMAYTAGAAGKIRPEMAYHYFHAGPVIGDFHEISAEVGLGSRFEFGYTREIHINGSDNSQGLVSLWQNGFDIYNGKVLLLPENYKKTPWVPAISTGFIARTGVRNVGDYLVWNPDNPSAPYTNGKNNADFYVVATKVVTQIYKKAPIVLNAGVRETNAELWGMGGNATGWTARPFGAMAFVFTGPSKSTLIFGAEAAMQPHHPLGFPALNIPTTLTYCTRIVPPGKLSKMNVDFGVAQIAGHVMGGPAGVDLKARAAWGSQLTWKF